MATKSTTREANGKRDHAGATAALSPAQLAARWGIGLHKLLDLIDAGELVAIDLRGPGSSRPRWKITAEAIATFEARRSSRPAPKVAARRRKQPADGVIEFF